MRTLAINLGFSVLVAVAAGGCGGGNTADGGTTPDLAKMVVADMAMMPPADMAMMPADMAMMKVDLVMPPPMMATVMVGAGGNNFDPAKVTIAAGGTVKWIWASGNHNVVSGANAADNKFCSPSDMNCAAAPVSAAGFTYMHTFPAAGSFPYFCKPHLAAGMTGTVTVQ